MKIENEVFSFHPQCPFDKLQADPLQRQYLTHLQGQTTIQDIVTLYYKMGWLVDFQKLYELISSMAQTNWILNPNIINYFQNLQLKNSSTLKNSNGILKKTISTDLSSFLELPFFRSLNPELANFLLKGAQIYTFNPDDLICKTGDVSRDLYVLLKGEAALYKPTQTHRQFISIISESSVFGESGFFLGEKRSADVLAIKKSEVLVVPYQADVLDQFLKKDKVQSLQQRFWLQHALLHSDLFKNFPADCMDALTFSGKIINLQNEQLLFKQGDLSQAAYIVIQGSLRVEQNNNTINVLPQGSFLGEISLMISGGKRSASVFNERNTLLLEIHKDDFYRLLSQNLYLAKEIQALANQRINDDRVRANKI